MNISVANGEEELKDFAGQAFDNGLFHPGWTLANLLTEIKSGTLSNRKVSLALAVNEKPIGVALYGFDNKKIDIYVDPTHRRKGIGSKLIRTIVDEYKLDRSELIAYQGEEWSSRFFARNGICDREVGIGLTKEEFDEVVNGVVKAADLIESKRKGFYANWFEENKHQFNF